VVFCSTKWKPSIAPAKREARSPWVRAYHTSPSLFHESAEGPIEEHVKPEMKPQSGLRHSWKRGVWGKPVFHPQAALEGLPGALLGFHFVEQATIVNVIDLPNESGA
jgi:hypothetical protein